MIANRLSIDGKVYNTDFVSNRAARVAEEISRDMGLTIANEVRKQKQYRKVNTDPVREAVKKELQGIAYGELGRKHPTTLDFLEAIIRRGVKPEFVKNKQGKVYGLRFHYKEQTFKASEIGREFGLRSLFNQHGQRLKGQKGISKVPRFEPPQVRQQPSHAPQDFIDSFVQAMQSGGSEDDFYNELEEQKRLKKKKRQHGFKR